MKSISAIRHNLAAKLLIPAFVLMPLYGSFAQQDKAGSGKGRMELSSNPLDPASLTSVMSDAVLVITERIEACHAYADCAITRRGNGMRSLDENAPAELKRVYKLFSSILAERVALWHAVKNESNVMKLEAKSLYVDIDSLKRAVNAQPSAEEVGRENFHFVNSYLKKLVFLRANLDALELSTVADMKEVEAYSSILSDMGSKFNFSMALDAKITSALAKYKAFAKKVSVYRNGGAPVGCWVIDGMLARSDELIECILDAAKEIDGKAAMPKKI